MTIPTTINSTGIVFPDSTRQTTAPYITPEAHGAVGDGVTDDTSAFQACIAAASATGKKIFLTGIYSVGNLDCTSVQNLTMEGVTQFSDPKTYGSPNGRLATNPYTIKGQIIQQGTSTFTVTYGFSAESVVFTRAGLGTFPCAEAKDAVAVYNNMKGVSITSNQSSVRIERCSFFGHDYPIYFTNSGGTGLLARCHFRYNIVDCLNGPFIADTGEPCQIEGNYLYPITTINSNSTITITSPGVINHTAHGFSANQRVWLNTNGALPTGLVPTQIYYVVNPTTDSYQLATDPDGGAIGFSGTQSGTHWVYPIEGTLRKRALFLAQRDTATYVAHNAFFGYEQGVQLGVNAEPRPGGWVSNIDFIYNHLECPPTTGTHVGIAVFGEYIQITGNFIIGWTYPIFAEGRNEPGNDSFRIDNNQIVLAYNSPYAVHIERGYASVIGNNVQGLGVAGVYAFDLSSANFSGGQIYGNVTHNVDKKYAINTSAATNTYVDGWTPWISWTPTVKGGNDQDFGAYTLYYFKYRKSVNSIRYTAKIKIDNQGSAASDIRLSLPVAASLDGYCGSGRQDGVNGALCQSIVSASTTLVTWTYDNGFPAATNSVLTLSGEYPIASADSPVLV